MGNGIISDILRCGLIVGLLVTGISKVTTAEETLKFYAVNYPPYDIAAHPSGKRGFDVEVVEAAFSAVGINVQIEFLPWKRIMSEVEAGTATGAVTCGDVPARRKWSYLSDRISVTRLAIVVRRTYNDQELKTVMDLNQVSVVAINGYSSEKELTKLGIEHVKTNTIESALKMLAFRQSIQAFYGGWESTQFVASEMGYREQFTFMPDTSKTPYPFYICFSQKWPGVKAIIAKFNKGLKEIRHRGIYQAIHAKYE